jgi:hypothetical protein
VVGLAKSRQRGDTWLVLVLSLTVFLLGLHGKLCLYGSATPPVNDVAASKLWLSADKMKVQTFTVAAPLHGSFPPAAPRPVLRVSQARIDSVSAPRPIRLFERHRFLRPPPAA